MIFLVILSFYKSCMLQVPHIILQNHWYWASTILHSRVFIIIRSSETDEHISPGAIYTKMKTYLLLWKNVSRKWYPRPCQCTHIVCIYFFLHLLPHMRMVRRVRAHRALSWSAGICVANVLYISVLAVPLSWESLPTSR